MLSILVGVVFIILFALFSVYRHVCKTHLPPLGTFFRTCVRPTLIAIYLSDWYLRLKRQLQLLRRQILRRKPILRVFVAADDPQSWIILQVLPTFTKRFTNIRIEIIVIKLGANAWSTSKAQQIRWAIKDCSLFAALYSLIPPTPMKTSAANAAAIHQPNAKHTIEYGKDNNLPVDTNARQKMQDVTERMLVAATSRDGSSNNDSDTDCDHDNTIINNVRRVLADVWGCTSDNDDHHILRVATTNSTHSTSSANVTSSNIHEPALRRRRARARNEATDAGSEEAGTDSTSTFFPSSSHRSTAVTAAVTITSADNTSFSAQLSNTTSTSASASAAAAAAAAATLNILEANTQLLHQLGYYAPGIIEFEVSGLRMIYIANEFL